MLRKYRQLFSNWLQRLLTYRARIAIWIVRDMAMFVIFPFIWLSLYGSEQYVAGFSKADIVTYYVIVAFINVVVTSHIGEVIKRDIVRGDLNLALLQPIHYLFYHVIHELTYRVFGLCSALLFTFAIALFSPHWLVIPHDPTTWLLFGAALFSGFLISQALQTLIGITAFWLSENSALNQAATLLQMLFSGEIAPLSFFPVLVQSIAVWLPFKYVVYFPAQIYLHQLSPAEITHSFIIITVWMIVILAFILAIWKRGLRHYDGSGI